MNDNSEKQNETEVKSSADLKQKFNPGDPVILKGNLLGVILNGYLWTMMDAKKYLYRVIVDANDAVCRIINNNVDQTTEEHLFAEDYDTLMWRTDQMAVVEIFEEDIIKYQP